MTGKVGAREWLVFNVGCIECGVSSAVVGVFEDEAEANALAETLDRELSWRQGGQNSFEVFPLPALGVIAEEYEPAIAQPKASR